MLRKVKQGERIPHGLSLFKSNEWPCRTGLYIHLPLPLVYKAIDYLYSFDETEPVWGYTNFMLALCWGNIKWRTGWVPFEDKPKIL